MSEETKELSGRVAVLTGGGGGIGRAIATALTREGATVAIADVDVSSAESVAVDVSRVGHRGIAVPMDVTSESSVATGVRSVVDQFGRLDIVVTLAAVIDTPTPVWELPKETWDRSIDVELTGTFLVCREALRRMIPERRGKIINVASVAGKMAYALRASYAVAKAGVIRLTECLALEAGRYGIQVNAICPGPTAGERMNQVIALRAAATGRSHAEVEADYRATTVLGQFPQPDDIAAMVVHLASRAGDRITGQAIDIDAGYLLS